MHTANLKRIGERKLVNYQYFNENAFYHNRIKSLAMFVYANSIIFTLQIKYPKFVFVKFSFLANMSTLYLPMSTSKTWIGF